MFDKRMFTFGIIDNIISSFFNKAVKIFMIIMNNLMKRVKKTTFTIRSSVTRIL